MPEWYLDEPSPGLLDAFYMKCFWELSSTRNYQHGYIPWNYINEYGRHVGLNDDIIETFTVIMRTMDEAYLGWVIDQAERNRDKQKAVDSPQVIER